MHPATSAFQNSASAPPPDRLPLTRRHAERLLWREEWRAHSRTLGMGAALWIWLYLVPGQTAQAGQLLGWSLAWAGVSAMLIAGRDLRHGIDPLMRLLAPPHHVRWHMRAAIILLASFVFYTLALFSIEGQWAAKLWNPLANGPFVANQAETVSPFQPWQGLSVVAGAALAAALAASCLHGIIFNVAFTAVFIVLATQLSGDHPGLVAYLTPAYEKRAIEYEATTRTFGLAGLGVAVGAWLLGAFIARRRPVITTHSDTAEAQAASAGLAFSLLTVIAVLLWARTILSGYSSDGLTWAVFLPAAISILLAAWWAHIRRARKSHSLPSRRSKMLAAVIGILTATHLGLYLWQVFYLPVSPLRETWPPVMEDLKVHTGQTADEAYRQYGSVRPTSLDIFLFTHFDAAYSTPFSLRSYTIEVPAPGESRHIDVELPLPGDPAALLTVRLDVDSPPQRQISKHIFATLTPNNITLSPAAEALSYTTTGLRLDSPGMGFLIFHKHPHPRPDLPLARKTAGLPITCRLLAIPRLPGQPTRELSWDETVRGINRGWHIHSAYEIPGHRGSGVKGLLGNGIAGVFWLGIPLLVFGSFAHHYCRNWPWVLLGSGASLLFCAIWIDGLRQENLLRMSHDSQLPPPQRDLATGWLRSSYFHHPKKFRSSHGPGE